MNDNKEKSKSNIKEQYKTLDDLMFNNQEAKKNAQKKKLWKQNKRKK